VNTLLDRAHSFKKVFEADVNIGLLVSVHDDPGDNGSCSELLPDGVILSEAMSFAVNQISSRYDLLPNVTIGYIQMDDCWNDLQALKVAVYLVNDDDASVCGNDDLYFQSYDVVGILGPSNSAMSVAVSKFLGTFQIPVMSLYATNNALSAKTEYPFFMRLASPDIRQEQLLLQVHHYLHCLHCHVFVCIYFM